ncbi:hypothetical protein JF540_27765, partial [Salipiger thiooxidans]|uniref:hypothetical protein n=1 Tax=Salipiger thiooxidans TaxID=282683 RepID=UPI001A8ED442
DTLWDEWLPGTELRKGEGKKKPGPKPKASDKTHLKVLVLDLYVAWTEDPELSIGVHMSRNEYKAGSRYNAIHVSSRMIDVIKVLKEVGLIDLAPGFHVKDGAKSGRLTRIRASERLQAMFLEAKFTWEDVTLAEKEIIILKSKGEKVDNASKGGKRLEYEDTALTRDMRKQLREYNTLVSSHFIDIPSLDEPRIQPNPDDHKNIVRIGLRYSLSHRVFNRGSWEMGGRYYGGWWQRTNEKKRAQIAINNEPTVEVDFKGLHVAMLYAEAGLEMEHDPYDIQGEMLELYGESLRPMVKRLALTAINAKDQKSAYLAFRDGFPTGDPAKNMTNDMLNELLEAFLCRNPPLRDAVFSDQGIRLMYKDSLITSSILGFFTLKGIPVLSVHDSYIIDHWHVDELRDVMAHASRATTGFELPTAIKLPDRPEYSDVSSEDLRQYVDVTRRIEPSAGYIARMKAFELRTGRSISPPLWSEAELLAIHNGEW